MQIDNAAITDAIKKAAVHYSNNIANRFTARALTKVAPSDAGLRSRLAILTEQLEDYHLAGLHVEDLYSQILEAAQLVRQLRTEVLPHIRGLVYADVPVGQPMPPDKHLRDWAITNFGPNLNIYSELLMDVFVLVEAYDIGESQGKRTVSSKFPELKELRDILGIA